VIAALGAPWSELDWQGPLPAMAGLSWVGCDNELFASSSPDAVPVLAKVPRSHTAVIGNRASRIAALIAAGEVGLGPAVLAADPGSGVVVQAASPRQMGTLLRIGRPGAMESYLTARSAFRRLPVDLAARLSPTAQPPRRAGAAARSPTPSSAPMARSSSSAGSSRG